jgi:ribosomal protein S18 acetylase RimI-like enzyme
VRIWRATPAEAPQVAALLAGFRNHMGRDWPSDEAFLATVKRLIVRDDVDYLLAAPDGDGRAQGVVQLRFRWTIWWGAEDCWLEDLYVSEAARGAGLGRALVVAALERAAERGCKRVDLDVDPDNGPAQALYASLGFREGPQRYLRRRL